VECEASVASDFDGNDRRFGGRKLILLLRGYKGSGSLKRSRPRRLPL
jgi:hypothetical protein